MYLFYKLGLFNSQHKKISYITNAIVRSASGGTVSQLVKKAT
jgi:hypothetical protein